MGQAGNFRCVSSFHLIGLGRRAGGDRASARTPVHELWQENDGPLVLPSDSMIRRINCVA
jgi:hypothetical protein